MQEQRSKEAQGFGARGWIAQEPFTTYIGRRFRATNGIDAAVFEEGRDGNIRLAHATTYGNANRIDLELATGWFGEGFTHIDASGAVLDLASALGREVARRLR